MTSFEKFKELHRRRIALAEMRWTATKPDLRLFSPDDGSRTSEYTISEADQKLFNEACNIVEYEGSSNISFCASYDLGNAVKTVVLRHIDKQLTRLALESKAEAEAVLATLKT